VQFKLADMATELTAARLMVHRAASLVDADAPEATFHCAMAKRFATDIGSKVANDALQLHGGYGYLQVRVLIFQQQYLNGIITCGTIYNV